MIKLIRASWWVVLLALCLAPCALAQGQVDIQFTGGYSSYTYLNYGDINGYVATGLYSATVDGQTTYIVCDDLTDSVTNGEKWNANAITLANSGTGTLFGSTIQVQGYVDMAYLANYMYLNQGTMSGSQFTGISLALWNITDSGLTGTLIAEGKSVWDNTSFAKTLTWSQLKALNWAMNLILSANPQLSQLDGTLYIYTPVGAKYTGEPQEMFGWVPDLPMPEGGSAAMYLLLAGLSCFGAMFFRHRRSAPGVRPAA
jgi:hypothetical protein